MEFLRESIEAHGLAVPLRVRHAEVANDVLLGRRSLLLANDDDRTAIKLGDAADDRWVVAERAVSVELLKALEHAADDVEGVRARDVPRGLHGLPGRRPTRRELRSVGNEPRLDDQMAVPLGGAARTDDAVEHRHD